MLRLPPYPHEISHSGTNMRFVFSRILVHSLILTLSIVVTLSMRAAMVSRYAAERRAIEYAGKSKRILELAKQWNAFSYTNLKGSDFVESLFSKLKLETLS